MEDIVLVKKAIEGDSKAFEDLIEKYQDRLYTEVHMRCKDEEDTKEIIQEVLYKAYKNIGTLKEPQYFKTWISRIAINTCNDYLRQHGMIDLELKESDYIKEEKVDDKSVIKIDLYNAIDELEDKYKDAIILKYIEDLTIEETAKKLDRPINTIKTHLRKAITDMRNLLKEGYCNEEK